MTHKAIFAGSFDPFTLGHLDIAKRFLKSFASYDLVILIADSKRKKHWLSLDQRISIIESCFPLNNERIQIASSPKLTSSFAKDCGANLLVRGCRNSVDWALEQQLSIGNKKLNPDLDTIVFPVSPEYIEISSSIVREIHSCGGDISQFVTHSTQKTISSL